jgi:hypothetical protein
MVVRDQVTSVEPEELSDNRIVHQKAPYFRSAFRIARDLRDFNVTDTRPDNFAEKRQEKRSSRPLGPSTSVVIPEWVGPPLAPLTSEDIRRIISISDPSNQVLDHDYSMQHRKKIAKCWQRYSVKR